MANGDIPVDGRITSEEADRLLNRIVLEESSQTRGAYRDIVRDYIRKLETDNALLARDKDDLLGRAGDDRDTIERLWWLVLRLREFPQLRRAVSRTFDTPEAAYTADEGVVRRLAFEFLAEDVGLTDMEVYGSFEDWLREAKTQH